MDIRVPRYQGHNSEIRPLRRRLVECIKGDQKRESPYLQDDCGTNTAVDDLADKGHDKQQAHPQKQRWDAQKTCLRSREAKAPEGERKICLRWNNRHYTQAKYCEWRFAGRKH